MTTIAIISDTHMPRGTWRLPEACIERLRAADLIVHGGDFSALSVLEELRGYGEVRAVYGNADDEAVRASLPEREVFTVAAVRIAIVHNGGPAKGRISRLAKRFPGVDAVIFGHSHMPLHEQDPDSSFQIFNPGSPTDKRREPHFTMGWAEIADAAVGFELITL